MSPFNANSSRWLPKRTETHMVNALQESQRASKKHNRHFLWSVCSYMTQYLVVYNLPSINHQTKQIKCTFVSYSPPLLQRSWMLQRNLFHLNDYIQCQLETKIRTDATLLQEGVNSWLNQGNKVACSAHRLLHIYTYVVSSFVVNFWATLNTLRSFILCIFHVIFLRLSIVKHVMRGTCSTTVRWQMNTRFLVRKLEKISLGDLIVYGTILLNCSWRNAMLRSKTDSSFRYNVWLLWTRLSSLGYINVKIYWSTCRVSNFLACF